MWGNELTASGISSWCNKSVLTQPCCQISTHETSCNKLSEHIQEGPTAAPNKLSHHWLILVATSADARFPDSSLILLILITTHLALVASVKSALPPLRAARTSSLTQWDQHGHFKTTPDGLLFYKKNPPKKREKNVSFAKLLQYKDQEHFPKPARCGFNNVGGATWL